MNLSLALLLTLATSTTLALAASVNPTEKRCYIIDKTVKKCIKDTKCNVRPSPADRTHCKMLCQRSWCKAAEFWGDYNCGDMCGGGFYDDV
ncbi:hypothetical protein J1614_010621 [Plenodomus biglobosus]|nr:hypothetical protein J1614_010621 [Plenodomus biglobosus]